MREAQSLSDLVGKAQILLSIVPPAQALQFATQICPIVTTHNPSMLFVDCNAVAPQTLQKVASIAAASAVRFQDVGIIGAAPRPDRIPVRFYTSGPFADDLAALATEHIHVEDLGAEIGRASAIKMVYASLTKATSALRAAALIAGQRLGVGDEIHREWQHSLPSVYQSMQERLPVLSADASRWAGEMREIATTYDSISLTPLFHEAAEWIFDALAATELGDESKREASAKNRTLREVVDILSASPSVYV
jgi:3-hydroxyisobutyrate dehydrogenase-like beta-hydroxyacid dehydrogenase